MSRRGNWWDKACVESFFGTLTRELIYQRQNRIRDEATQDIFAYIEVFSNRLRRHSTLGYDSPAEFEARTAVAYPGVHGIGGRSGRELHPVINITDSKVITAQSDLNLSRSSMIFY